MPAPVADPAANFEALFSQNADPWAFKTRWYEVRKRALTLAALPEQRYLSGYEPGCANGELSAALAARCDRLLVTDGAAAAVRWARERLAPWAHVNVAQAWLPAQWPAESFDLIVISELAYYLSIDELDRLAQRIKQSLLSGGTVLACHWRHPIEGCALDGDGVHERLHSALALSPLSVLVERDFRIDVWSSDPRSVPEREGWHRNEPARGTFT